MSSAAEVLNRCDCGSSLVADRWMAKAGIQTQGVRLRLTVEIPRWANSHVLQGMTVVTRYRCPCCGHVAAILARDGGQR